MRGRPIRRPTLHFLVLNRQLKPCHCFYFRYDVTSEEEVKISRQITKVVLTNTLRTPASALTTVAQTDPSGPVPQVPSGPVPQDPSGPVPEVNRFGN